MDYTCTYQDTFGMDKFQLSLDAQLKILEEQIAVKLSKSFSIISDTTNLLKKILCKVKSKWQEEY